MNPAGKKKQRWVIPGVLGLAVLCLWVFPGFWYSQESDSRKVWLTEQEDLPGWSFESIPISEAAERSLVADRTVNGEFRNEGGEAVRVFSANRYVENPNEIGLFVHTPDRCWVQGGWRIESIIPDVSELTLHGVRLTFERRLFRMGSNKELVYFCGLVDGQALPYRLDHNLSQRNRAELNVSKGSRTFLRVAEGRMWNRLWNSFTNRRQLFGAKQFFRISTPIEGEELSVGDARLERFIADWLKPGAYTEEGAKRAVLN